MQAVSRLTQSSWGTSCLLRGVLRVPETGRMPHGRRGDTAREQHHTCECKDDGHQGTQT